jgi:S1-C subfamily serine protease
MIGETVIAIGSALGQPFTVTSGIISALNRSIETADGRTLASLIQTNADINQGNSGGPLININGEFIGLNTAILSPTGASVGLGFATPVSRVKKVYDYWIHGVISLEDQLGAEFQDMAPPIREFFWSNYPDLKDHKLNGVVVLQVSPTGIGNGYLQRQDIVTAIDQVEIRDKADLLSRLEEHRGPTLTLNVISKGKVRTIPIPVPNRKVETYRWGGMEVQSLDKPWRRWFNLPEDQEGLVVLKVDEMTGDNQADIRRGDLMLSFNGKEIKSLEDFQSIVQTERPRRAVVETFRQIEKRKGMPQKWEKRTVQISIDSA